MSAFLVSKRTIDHCVDAIMNCRWHRRGENRSFDQLGSDLWRMNQDAIMARYGDDDGARLEYDYTPTAPNIYRRLKAMHCLKYQCSEGRVPETADYKLLSEVIDSLESEIITSIPEYKSEPWDIPD